MTWQNNGNQYSIAVSGMVHWAWAPPPISRGFI